MNTLYAGLVVWLVTLILVESRVAEPFRSWVARTKSLPHKMPPDWPPHSRAARCQRRFCGAPLEWSNVTQTWVPLGNSRICQVRRHPHLTYLVNCHLCTGIYVGVAVALVIPGPFAWWLNALLFKAVGHGVLEVTALLRRTNP